MKKSTQLKRMIHSDELEFIMEAHNGLSAKIVEEAGFKGIWGSGLSISAAMGVRDNNEASWSQVLDVVEFMSDATTIPILLDGDTGYGNFNNMRRLVKKLEQRNVAGVCIEDKLFPKTNSFINGEAQPLADMDEFCGKIKAAKDTQLDEDFVVVARLEAFISGWGLGEALKRAEAYRLAGADAILCHSKKNTLADIEAFMKEWDNRHPVIIVPTKYYAVPTERYRDLKISLAIWANHNIRTSITAMQKTTRQIFMDQSLINVEDKVASVNEVFRLQGADELEAAEDKYLPATGQNINNIILAASQGNLGELTKESPKTLIKINGKSLLETQVDIFNQTGIKDITVVRGFGKEKIKLSNIKNVDNDEFASTKELYSLFLAKDHIKEHTIVSYGDILFKSYILNDLIHENDPITMIIDADCDKSKPFTDYVQTSESYSKLLYAQNNKVEFKKMSTDLEISDIHGEFIGLWKVNAQGAKIVKEALQKLSQHKDFRQMTCIDLFNEIAKTQKIAVCYIKGSWIDVDSLFDLQTANSL